jgi:recombinational DNA repair ATPase RecF
MEHTQLLQQRLALLARKAQLRDEIDAIDRNLQAVGGAIQALEAAAAKTVEPEKAA